MPIAQFTRLVVHNYQSIGHADLELGQINVIVGRWSLGKSALMRALNALLTNETGTDYIRFGEDECYVRVELSDGTNILWTHERASSATYDVTWPDGKGRKFDKLAGGVPEEVAQLLNIRPIVVDKDFQIMPQVHEQFDQPLLLRESAGRVARALAKTTKLDGIMQAQGYAVKDLKGNRTTLKTSSDSLSQARARSAAFPDVAHQRAILEAVQEDTKTIEARDRELSAAQECRDELLNARDDRDVALPDTGALAAMMPHLDRLKQCFNLQSRIEDERSDWAEAAEAETLAKHDCVNLDQAIHELLAEFDVCPVCERPMPRA